MGSRKGKRTARLPKKKEWVLKVRSQRRFINALKDKNLLSNKNYRDLYSKIKSNRFRNIRLIKLYIEENKLIQKNEIQKKVGR